jgi:hypothetical protein
MAFSVLLRVGGLDTYSAYLCRNANFESGLGRTRWSLRDVPSQVCNAGVVAGAQWAGDARLMYAGVAASGLCLGTLHLEYVTA